MESAELAVRPRLDAALCNDGRRRLAGVARGRVESAEANPGPVPGAMGAECAVDAALLRSATAGIGLRGNHHPGRGRACDSRGILACKESRWPSAGTVYAVDSIRHGFELHDLAIERMNILVIPGHPLPGSLNRAMADRVCYTTRRNRHGITRHDLSGIISPGRITHR
jgi:hypothetical protein